MSEQVAPDAVMTFLNRCDDQQLQHGPLVVRLQLMPQAS